ncbi:uncharacterized protein Dyak_GE12971 [Drosophila yakuba]|uniref:Uncharacterized protein n=1 Tax=Drosophila yakuba TaxID=7245 RepID=B4P6E2_DROYA|nr:uncharacterized protein Dyak_GE12971 [Drosophila yakuba]
MAGAADIFKYEAPLVPLQKGTVWRVNGHFKLAHVIDLGRLEPLIQEAQREAVQLTDPRIAVLVAHYLEESQEGLSRLMGTQRGRRSLDWIGSASKWIAGSPDASDWDAILQAQESVVKSADQQLRINAGLFDASHESLRQLNEVTARVNAIDGDLHAATTLLHKALIIDSQVGKLTQACQLAKTGIVNSRLLDHEEVQSILTEVSNLLYQNAVKALEFSRPSVLTNGTALLYILAMPKVAPKDYRLLLFLPATLEGKQVMVKHDKVAVNSKETMAQASTQNSPSGRLRKAKFL